MKSKLLNQKTLEEQIAKIVTGKDTIDKVSAKIDKLIRKNLEEALNSKSEFLRDKARQIIKVI